MKKNLVKFISNLIPVKKWRHSFRNKFNKTKIDKISLYSLVERLYLEKHNISLQCLTPDISKLKALKNINLGQRCFILGTAPSIKQMDLTKLDNEFVFTANKGYLLQESGLKNIYGYAIADPEAFRDFYQEINWEKMEHIFLQSSILCDDKNIIEKANVYNSFRFPKMYEENGFFQFNLENPLYDSHTVILHLLQMAVYMGFREIYFIGVDMNFVAKEPHFYNSSNREILSANSRSIKNTPKMLLGFQKASNILKERGVKLYNAGIGGKLDCMERVDFKNLF